jgi:hypothetical protein
VLFERKSDDRVHVSVSPVGVSPIKEAAE